MKFRYVLLMFGLVYAGFYLGNRYHAEDITANGSTLVELVIVNEITVSNHTYLEARPKGGTGLIWFEGKKPYQKGQRVNIPLVPIRIVSWNGARIQAYREV